MPNSKEDKPLKQLEACRWISEIVNTISDPELIHQLILAIITHPAGLGCDRALLFLADEQNHSLSLHAAVGPINRFEAESIRKQADTQNYDLRQLIEASKSYRHPTLQDPWIERLGGFVVPLGTSGNCVAGSDDQLPLQVVVSNCASTKQCFLSNSVQAVFEPPPAFGTEILQFQHLAALPIQLGVVLLGVLVVDNYFNQRELVKHDLEGLAILANLTAASIDKSRMGRQLEENTHLDGVTGLYNRQHYEASLDLEIERARKSNKPLSLLAFHVHHYPELYREHGWYHSDRLLKELAACLQKTVRAEDMIIRFGRADFVILFTGGAAIKDAVGIGEKLIAEITSLKLGNLAPGAIQISAGLGSLHAHSLTRERVSNMAEEVLEGAKKEKPGGVVFLEPG